MSGGVVWLIVLAGLAGGFGALAWRFAVLSDGHAALFDQLVVARGTVARHRAVRDGFAARAAAAEDDARALAVALDAAQATIAAQQVVIAIVGEALDDAVEDNEVMTRALAHAVGVAATPVPARVLEIVR